MCKGDGDDKNEEEKEEKKKGEKEKEAEDANNVSDSDSEDDIVFFDDTYTGNDEKDDFFVIVDSDSESEESNASFNDEDKSMEEEEEEEPKTPKIEPPEEDNDDDDDDAVVFQANTTEYLEGFEYINYDEDTITRASTSTFLSPTKEGSNNNNDNEKKEKDDILDNFTDEENDISTIYNDNDSNGDDDDDEDIVFYNYGYFDEEEEEEDVNESGWKFFTEDSDDENSSRIEYAETTQIENSSNEAQTSDSKSTIRSQQQKQQEEESEEEEESDIDDDEVAFTEEVSDASSNSSLFRAARAIKSALRGDQHLVRRDRELTYLREYLTACRFADMPGCFYVSGPPGTGKTTAVRRVVSGLSTAAPGNWATVCVDCIQLSKAGASELFRTIATQLGLHNTSASTSQKAVEERLCSRELPPVAMIVDEADALFSRARRRLLFTIFTFPLLRGSRCIVIAVANASRPPASFWKKLRSRIGIWRVHFGPYSAEDLEAIVNARIESIPQHDDVVDKVAVHSIAVRLAVTCGDARRMLMLTRAAIDNALGRLSQGHSNANATDGALVEKVDVDTAIDEMLMADARTAGIATLPPHLAVLLAVIVRKCSIFGVQLDSEVAGSAAAAHPASGRGGCGWANVGEVMRDADQAWARFKTQNAPTDSLQEFVLALTLLQQTGLVRVMSESRRGRTPPEMWKVQATIDQETLLSSFKDENASSLILN